MGFSSLGVGIDPDERSACSLEKLCLGFNLLPFYLISILSSSGQHGSSLFSWD